MPIQFTTAANAVLDTIPDPKLPLMLTAANVHLPPIATLLSLACSTRSVQIGWRLWFLFECFASGAFRFTDCFYSPGA